LPVAAEAKLEVVKFLVILSSNKELDRKISLSFKLTFI